VRHYITISKMICLTRIPKIIDHKNKNKLIILTIGVFRYAIISANRILEKKFRRGYVCRRIYLSWMGTNINWIRISGFSDWWLSTQICWQCIKCFGSLIWRVCWFTKLKTLIRLITRHCFVLIDTWIIV
jgi:hypothetical protein